MSAFPNLTLLDHSLGRHSLAILRDEKTPSSVFKDHCHRISYLLIAEGTKHLSTTEKTITTPLEEMAAQQIDPMPFWVPVLRAGMGMLGPALELFPESTVGHLGLQRNEDTAEAEFYYEKLPNDLSVYPIFILDPMLATGGSACETIKRVKNYGGKDIRMLAIVAAPEGVHCIQEKYPDVQILAGALDRELNTQKFIVPGLGDFGDRYYNT